MPIFFIPARGRKRGYTTQRYPIATIDFLYPRKGTETSQQRVRAVHIGDFLYPREGTETFG